MDEWITQQIERLPASLLEYVSSDTFTFELHTILSHYEIEEEDKKAVRNEVYLFILGGTNPSDFPINIQLASLLDTEDAQKLALEVYDILIDPVASEIVDYWMKEIDSDESSRPSKEALGTRTQQGSVSQTEEEIQSTTTTLPPSEITQANQSVRPKVAAFQALSISTHQPGQKKTVTDQDIAEARKALSDPYREKVG